MLPSQFGGNCTEAPVDDTPEDKASQRRSRSRFVSTAPAAATPTMPPTDRQNDSEEVAAPNMF